MNNEITQKEKLNTAEALLQAAKRAGAAAADAMIVEENSTSVSTRLGKIETSESSANAEISLRVFIGTRAASVSATFSELDANELVQRAVAMAKASPEDPFQGLANSSFLAGNVEDLDLFDNSTLSPEDLKEHALRAEEAAFSVNGVTNSSGSQAGIGQGGILLVTSHGFSGYYKTSYFSRSISVVAGNEIGMERDYDFSCGLHLCDLKSAETIGRNAGERAVKRLNARKVKTGMIDVIFEPRVARSLAGHMAAAINGAAIARKTSFLQEMIGKKVMADNMTMIDDPLKQRGQGSKPFDGEGVKGKKLIMIEKGILNHWFLSTSVAKELQMETNGRGVRSSSSVVPSYTNLSIEPGQKSVEEIIKGIKNGFYVTELIGQGVNLITGEYSRAASGYWIENSEIAFPVSGAGLASNLKDMFLRMTAANDVDQSAAIAVPSLLVEGMILGGI